MLIAVSAGGRELVSAVRRFETCRWLLFIETDDMTIDAVRNTEDISAEALAQMVVERDCEAVITASFTPGIFNIIADACITRYNGTGFSVREAIEKMDNYTLDYIRYADKDDTCRGEHSGGECNCGEDDDE
jgi:predicted Fe-Mo cluster-binding NifX family protein